MAEHTRRGRGRSLLWLAGALGLLLLAAWLFGGGDSPQRTEARTVEFPRFMDTPANERMVRRRSLTIPALPSADAGSEGPRTIDPVLAALPPRGSAKVAVVVEANALVHSAIGQAFLDCLGPEQMEAMAEIEKVTGVDLLRDLDRIATSDGVTIASGSFGAVAPAMKLLGGSEQAFGAHATVWSPPLDRGGPHVARWKDEMVLVAADRAQLEAALQRLDDASSGAPTGEPAIGEHESYGEVYGALSPEVLDEILPPELAARLREVAERVELHASAQDDVGVVVEIDGKDGERVEELARALGGALAVGRVKAQADGEKELAELLDLASVDRSTGRLAVELALPRTWLESRVLGPCRERAALAREAREAARKTIEADPGDGGSP